ncbi:MAG: nitronate monooxygenase [Leptospirales bacterium]|nr:nitronate monooxygenase [Leptospirales bacterium]
MKIETSITRMLGIDLPIIGAPMFLVSYPDLVVAVSEAGGIGCFPALNYRNVDDLRRGLDEIRSRTSRPIGVNIILHKPHNPNWPEQLKVCLEKKVDLLIFSLGAARSAVNEAKAAGAKVFYDVTTLKHARIVQKAGADALIAVAQGAGGHAGAITPFSLIPYLIKETGLPVIAAGAISTGQQMAAALALGASAVYVGTRLIATPESKAQDGYKQMLIDSAPEEIVYTETISGIPANWLKKSVERMDPKQGAPAALAGDGDEYKRWRDIWSAGHGVAQIDQVAPAGEVVRGMAAEYLKILQTLPR